MERLPRREAFLHFGHSQKKDFPCDGKAFKNRQMVPADYAAAVEDSPALSPA